MFSTKILFIRLNEEVVQTAIELYPLNARAFSRAWRLYPCSRKNRTREFLSARKSHAIRIGRFGAMFSEGGLRKRLRKWEKSD